ncbi:MAG: helicase-related protein [Chitinophagales bacterium]|nr:helicase-related protein [Chitinophagales bacterium]
MSSKFFNNNQRNLFDKFCGIIENMKGLYAFYAVVAYFRSSGYFALQPYLKNVKQIKILVGINVDQMFAEAHRKGLMFFGDAIKTKEEFLNWFVQDIREAKYAKEVEDGILQFVQDLIDGRIEVRAHTSKTLHAKFYLFLPEHHSPHSDGWVIMGSSNLTEAGLGIKQSPNYELNIALKDYDDVHFAKQEFEKLWEESTPILPADIQQFKQKTHIGQTFTPYELYIKLLIEYFGKSIDYDPDSIGDLPQNFKKLSYQIDAVNEGFNMLLNHNGFVLADVVGLGKTVIATMVAKKFIVQNGKDRTKILVVYPPAVEKNWKNTFRYFQIDKYAKFITNGSLRKITEGHTDYWNKEEYDLVIVDEAHKFRNHTSEAFQNLQLICKSPRANHGFIEGRQKKVILVTATPLNNKPEDILYQIQMFQDVRQSTLPVTNLTSFFAPIIEEYKRLRRFDTLDITRLREIYQRIRRVVIEPITIRRTRKDLENVPEYLQDLKEQGIRFPKVQPPQRIEYVLDRKLNELFHRTVSYLIDEDKISYARYQAIAGLKPEVANGLYENAELVSKSLAFIMKTQLIKRLESSFYAFKKTLENFQKATHRMIEMFENDKVFIAPDTDVNKLLDKGWSEEEIEKEIERLSENNPKNKTFKATDFKPEFIESLKRDKELIDELMNAWNNIDYDPKLNVFMDHLNSKFLNKETNREGKLVIFSESKETVNYLQAKLKEKGRKDVLIVSAENREELYEKILANFDANVKKEAQRNDYNILITTEVLAEGVNLHRSNVIVHYDTPWNSTRLMQRIGRVNRIGTRAEEIYNYVFYPSAQGDNELRLNRTALMKIQAFHTAFGEDNQVYSEQEILDEAKLFNADAIKEEEDERLKYLHYLRNFRKENKEWFDKIKKIPLKARTGRNASAIRKPKWQNSTVVFLKNNQKFEFYRVDSRNQPNEITPLEAIKIFEAQPDEPACPLPDNHYEHVSAAIHHFETQEITLSASRSEPEALGGVAQRAKKFLNDLTRYARLSDKQAHTIRKMVELIDLGKYTNLPTEIDRLQKKRPNMQAALLEIEKIVKKYDIEDAVMEETLKPASGRPVIILSESFV